MVNQFQIGLHQNDIAEFRIDVHKQQTHKYIDTHHIDIAFPIGYFKLRSYQISPFRSHDLIFNVNQHKEIFFHVINWLKTRIRRRHNMKKKILDDENVSVR